MMIRLVRRFLIAVATLLLSTAATSAESVYRFDGVRRVVAFADVHGAYAELVSVLREAAVIDEALHWQAGDTHLVSLGDLLDRGPDSRKVMDLLMRLEGEARQTGGAVHVLLGNHEVMNIVGDLRYVSAAEYAAFAGSDDAALREKAWQRIHNLDPAAARAEFDTQFPPGYFAHRQGFSRQGQYGGWLLTKPFVITINDTAFVHAGLPEMVARLGLEGTNQTLHSQLADYQKTWQAIETELSLQRPIAFPERSETVSATGAEDRSKSLLALQGAEVFTPAGPTWYRGQALCYPYAEAENLGASLEKLEVARVIAGHTVTPTGRVMSRFDGRVILLDTGMLQPVYHGTPATLVFEGGRWSVDYADRSGQRFQPDTLPRAVGPRPRGLDDDALEQWFAEAEVVAIEDLDTGITKPQRVTLRKDGIELRAVFKQLSTDFNGTSRVRATFESDRFEYELAAYKLDRLLGLDMVPVTVLRTINKRKGVLQFWIDGSINLRHMLEQKLVPEGWCDTNAQYNLMNVFDVLIHNTDRTQENALFTRDWMLVLIDHSRAFPTHSRKPVLLYKGGVDLPPDLAVRLRTLNREMLQTALGPYLHRRQIDALLKRRDQLLSEDRAPVAHDKLVAP
ncbi:MAG: metallophosphoesterase [Steroidobacteraceae bacterium]